MRGAASVYAAPLLPPSRRHSASRRRARSVAPRAAAAAGDSSGATPQPLAWPSLRPTGAPDANKHFDVSGVVVAPSFRASSSFTAAQAQVAARGSEVGPVRVLFLSEGNVCRSVLAEALFNAQLAARGLDGAVLCESKGTRDYNVGEGPEPAATAVAQSMGVLLRADHVARKSDFAADVVLFDLLLTMDKFTAADVMREVSVYDTIDPSGRYNSKVRSLTQFYRGRKVLDEIDDPLYERGDDQTELAAVSAAAQLIASCCEGLADELAALVASSGSDSVRLRTALAARLDAMTPLDWLKPPMLSRKA